MSDASKRKPGRPGVYPNAAARASAWRQRQKDLLAQATAKAVEPVVVEKLVERVVEKPVYLPAPKRTGRSPKAEASRLAPLVQARLRGFGAEARAKALRGNAARVASTARELLTLLAADWERTGIGPVEQEFLEDVERFFTTLQGTFERTQQSAKVAAAQAEKASRQRHAEQLRTLTEKTFGANPQPEQVRALAGALKAFAADDAWLAARYGVDRGTFYINRSYEFDRALRSNDIAALASEVAAVRLDAGERGRAFTYQDERCYAAGWPDFETWHAEQQANAKKPGAEPG